MGGCKENSLFEEALAPSESKLRACSEDQQKKENLSTSVSCVIFQSWKILISAEKLMKNLRETVL